MVDMFAMSDPSTPAPPEPSGRVVTAGALAAALGTSTTTLRRWIDQRKIPEPLRAPPGVGESGNDRSWRKWPIEIAIEVVRNAGRTVPADWQSGEEKAA
jgi:hypothetical protein